MVVYWLGICMSFPIGYTMYIIWTLKFDFRWEDWSPYNKVWNRSWRCYEYSSLKTPRETLKFLLDI